MAVPHPFETRPSYPLVDARRSPRFNLEVEIRVYARNQQVIRGHSVDISESGIAAMLAQEITLDEVVRLEFTLPAGGIEIHALVRQRRAFRYGFEFIEGGPARKLISRTCRDLAVEQALHAPCPL